MFFFVSIVAIVNISTFAILLNCLYLKPWGFYQASTPPHCGVGGRVSGTVVLDCRLWLNHDIKLISIIKSLDHESVLSSVLQFLGKLQGNWNRLTWSLFGIMLWRSQGSGKTSQDSISREWEWNYAKKNSSVMFKQASFVLTLSSCAFMLLSLLLLLFFDFCHTFYCMMNALTRNLICIKVWSYWSTYKRPHAIRQSLQQNLPGLWEEVCYNFALSLGKWLILSPPLLTFMHVD